MRPEVPRVQLQGPAELLVRQLQFALAVATGEKNPAGQYPNPTSDPAGATQTVWVVAWADGEPRKVDAGHSPKISARGTIAYIRDGQVWLSIPVNVGNRQ